jgi:putative endonuclease
MFIYGLYNKENKRIYIGQTANLEKRLEEHNKKRGKHFTAKTSGEWALIYKEEVLTRKEALIREKELKSYKGRQFIKQYIPR